MSLVLITYAVETVLMMPLKIWLSQIAIPSLCAFEIRSWHGLLRERAEFILHRRQGSMSQANNFTQHFNPACRAARVVPHLPAARLLMAINDFDLPVSMLPIRKVSMLKKIEDAVFAVCLIVPSILSILPTTIFSIGTDVIVVAGANLFILIAIFAIYRSIYIPIAMAFALPLYIVIRSAAIF